MKFQVYDLERGETVRKPSLGACIYCGDIDSSRSEEHVIPYAIGGNTTILEDACCENCQRIIQPYEQQVLRNQLGIFRARIESPSRNKKTRPREQCIDFVEVNEQGEVLRNLGKRILPIEKAPLSFAVWDLAPPRALGENILEEAHIGRPWTSIYNNASQYQLALKLARQVGDELGAEHVAVKVGEVNRENFLRFIAKTAHALAVFEYGLDAFRWLTPDIILKKSDDLAEFVGCDHSARPPESETSSIVDVHIGVIQGGGPADGYAAVRLRLYPFLGTPAHIVIVGAPLEEGKG